MTAPSLEDFAVKLWWELDNFKIDNFCLLIDESKYKENGVEPSYGIDDEAVAADAQEAPSLEYPENMLLLLNKKVRTTDLFHLSRLSLYLMALLMKREITYYSVYAASP